MGQFLLDVAGLSDRGVKREHNEDAWSAPPSNLTPEQLATKGRLYIVADGVGGHRAGDVASTMAVQLIQQHYYASPSSDAATSLTKAIQTTSDRIDQEAAARPERRGMSTTVTAVALRDNKLTVANVGDSRTYLIRKGQAHQITADHSWVEEQVRIGVITPEEAAHHPQRNIITRSLGSNRQLEVDIFEEQLKPGDSVLLCSDGLSNVVTDAEFGAAISRGWRAEATVNELVDLAKGRGAPDNVTVVLLKVVRESRAGFGRLFVTVGVLGGLALLVAGLVWAVLAEEAENEEPIATEKEADINIIPDLASPLSASSVTTISPPELVWPAENTPIVADGNLTFTWKSTSDSSEDLGRFVFVLKAGGESQPLVREELALNTRRFVLTETLEPGSYIWTLSVLQTGAPEISSGRVFTVVGPTPTPDASN